MLAVVAGLLVAGGLADRAGAPSLARSTTVPALNPGPVAAPESALSSSWFCAGATDGASPHVPGRVVIANDSSRAVAGVVTVVPSRGHPARVRVSVPAWSSKAVAETVPGGSPWVGAVVDMDGGALAVDQMIDGPLGRSTTPCATSGSSHWYFSNGETRVNADEVITLLNPYPAESIVDLSFSTDQGAEAPQNLQGIDVPADGLVAVDVGNTLRRRSYIASTVSARTGSVVAWETAWVSPPPAGAPIVGTPAASAALADPALPVPGAVVALGAASPGRRWVWPNGVAGNGVDEEYVIYNPSSRTADVELSIGLEQGQAEPFRFTVGPGDVVPIVSQQQARIPSGVPHTATLTSVNDVPVVASRAVTAQHGSVTTESTATATGPGERHSTLSGGAAPPVERKGIADLQGGRVPAANWIVPAPATDSSHQGYVVVSNPSDAPLRVTVSELNGKAEAPLTGGSVSVAAAGRAVLAVPAGTSGPLVVRSSAPAYVEYDLDGAGVLGISFSFAIPLG